MAIKKRKRGTMENQAPGGAGMKGTGNQFDTTQTHPQMEPMHKWPLGKAEGAKDANGALVKSSAPGSVTGGKRKASRSATSKPTYSNYTGK